MRACLAHSEDPSTSSAAPELILQIREALGNEAAVAGLLFASISHDHQNLVDAINAAFPGIALIGCTTDGEVSSRLSFCEDSTTLVVFSGADVRYATGVGYELSVDCDAACKAAVQTAREALGADGVLCITTAESLTTSAVQLVEALKNELGALFPIVGGVAGDSWTFDGTRQFHRDEVLQDSVPLLLFDGPVEFSVAHASGWEPLPITSMVTRAEANVVFSIDGKPALDFYRDLLGPNSSTQLTPETPLAVFAEDGYYLRAPFSFDEEVGSVTFVGDVPDGSTIAMTKTMRATIVDASADSMSSALTEFPGEHPVIALFFSCAARKQLLGTKTGSEYEALAKELPATLPVCGFYTYGEIAPARQGAETRFHNQTCVSVIIGT